MKMEGRPVNRDGGSTMSNTTVQLTKQQFAWKFSAHANHALGENLETC
jgi:hypothetical protein